MRHVTVLGGSGFVGSAIVRQLSLAGYEVKVLTRRREAAKHIILLPNVDVIECNVMDDAALSKGIKGTDAVINLIGILHNSKKASFTAMHAELPARLAKVCAKLGIKRLVHMSALQASQYAPSAYLRSKSEGENAVLRANKNLDVTVFRPSIIFGRGDGFINLFATLVKLLPVILLAKPNAKFQPIYVEDVAHAFVASLDNIDTYGKAYDLGGPKVYTLRQLVAYVADTLGKKRPIIGLNNMFSYLQAFAMELMPVKLMTRDNVRSMEVDSVCVTSFPAFLGFQPVALETIVPDYLSEDNPRNAYNRFRTRAGR
jgi:NADH dehydrogenase